MQQSNILTVRPASTVRKHLVVESGRVNNGAAEGSSVRIDEL